MRSSVVLVVEREKGGTGWFLDTVQGWSSHVVPSVLSVKGRQAGSTLHLYSFLVVLHFKLVVRFTMIIESRVTAIVTLSLHCTSYKHIPQLAG